MSEGGETPEGSQEPFLPGSFTSDRYFFSLREEKMKHTRVAGARLSLFLLRLHSLHSSGGAEGAGGGGGGGNAEVSESDPTVTKQSATLGAEC